MKNVLLQAAAKLNKERKDRKGWQRVVTSMAAVVVFCTTYALILPAITLEQEVICGVEAHKHTDACYTEQSVTALQCSPEAADYILHIHNEFCSGADGTLVCTLPELTGHTHAETCFAQQTTLCALPEGESHAHTEGCTVTETVLVCTLPELQPHSHAEACYDADGTLICPLPAVVVHQHDAACLPAADAAETLLTCGMDEHEHDELCLPAAAEPEPVLTCGTGEHAHGEDCYDADGLELCSIPAHQHEDACWSSYQPEPTPTPTADPLVLAETAAALFEQLPDADALAAELRALNTVADREGYDRLLLQSTGLAQAAADAYEALTDEQKAGFTDLEALEALQLLLSEEAWQELPALTDDSAILTELTVTGTEVLIPQTETTEATGTPVVDEAGLAAGHKLVPGRTLLYHFSAKTASLTGTVYSAGRVRLELVLPLEAEQAAFDLEAMTWLEEAVLTTEERAIGEDTIPCQVLTGYVTLSADENGIAVPGSLAQTAAIQVLNASHNTAVDLLISAAMEHNAWDTACAVHGAPEKQTAAAPTYTVHAPATLTPETVSLAYLLEIEELFALALSEEEQYTAAIALLDRIQASFQAGELAETQYESLTNLVRTGLYGEDLTGELNTGTWWKAISTTTPTTSDASFSAPLMLASEPTQDPIVPYTMAMRTFGLRSTPASGIQIDDVGGENSADTVLVSKTIAGTELENVFDITLEIVTQDKIETVYEEPDMAVVIVMDISNTMNSTFGADSSTSRYAAAIAAAESFMEEFQQYAGTVSKVGYVAFNTNAHKIFDLSPCSTDAQRTALVNQMKTKTENIIYNYSTDDRTRFTNIEAGLRMAQNMLDGVNNKNKFVIFLSDGFPTTYTTSDTSTTGYDPYSTKGYSYNNGAGVAGVFYDRVYKRYTLYGTSYSDTAAIRARKQATAMKKAGTKIFSIGVDVGGQTLWKYHKQTNSSTSHSVVERPQDASYYQKYGYEIGTDHDDIGDAYPTDAQIAAYNATQLAAFNAKVAGFAQDFKDWLKGAEPSDSVERTGIGSGEGYYYDSDNAEGLTAAYQDIFEKILILNGSSSHLDWVATDPMPGMGVHELETIEFIAFWDLDGEELHDSITGTLGENDLYDENTVSFDSSKNTISWDLKKSIYYSQAVGDVTNYHFTLKYRVRLINEASGFVEKEVLPTNDVTSLSYRLIEVKDSVSYIGDSKSVEFPIPEVHGFLAELSFKKTSALGSPLPGAQFTLSHDTDACGFCRGDGQSSVVIADQTATSDTEGNVSFTNIPSGHTYSLTETRVPEGYTASTNTYSVVVAYDQLTVNVTDRNGAPVEWNGVIVNGEFYTLPSTGGSGTFRFALGGTLLVTAAAAMYIQKTGRKRRKEAVK